MSGVDPGMRERARRERVIARFATYALRRTRPGLVLRRAVVQARRAVAADGAELVALGERGAFRVALSGSGNAIDAIAGPVDLSPELLTLQRRLVRFDELGEGIAGEPWQSLGMRTVVCVPLRSRSHGNYQLYVFGARPFQFDPHDCATLENLALILTAALAGPRDPVARRRNDALDDYRSTAVLLESFAAVLAHEVRNPLNAISMNAEVAGMLLQRHRQEQVPAVLERVARDVQRCSIAIHELSTVAARDAGAQSVLVQELLQQVADRLHGLGYVPEPKLDIEVEPANLLLTGNALVLEFALLQVARALLMPGVDGLTLSARVVGGKPVVTMQRRGARQLIEQRVRVDAPMPPTRVAALALARHALAEMGATVVPEDLDSVPLRCAVTFPQAHGAAQ